MERNSSAFGFPVTMELHCLKEQVRHLNESANKKEG
jgi:hypothetical protein